MNETDGDRIETAAENWLPIQRLLYEAKMRAIRVQFEAHAENASAGDDAALARSAAVDELVRAVWAKLLDEDASSSDGICLVAVGGYGRGELFPCSDVDLVLLLDARMPERDVRARVRRMNQSLWDAGLRMAAVTRTLLECERFNAENMEFTLSLLDSRWVAGDLPLFARLVEKTLPKMLARDHQKITSRLLEVTRARHAKYGETLFHLEPNVKDGRGGLRDAHTCAWMARLTMLQASDQPGSQGIGAPPAKFGEARQFLSLVRTFLHLRHGRDDNKLDWQAQDAAAETALGTSDGGRGKGTDAAYWMRNYFRNARSIERRIGQFLDESRGPVPSSGPKSRVGLRKKPETGVYEGFEVRKNRICLSAGPGNPAHDPEVALAIFAAMAKSGARLTAEAESRMEQALPLISANLEDGPNLWRHLQAILLGGFAGPALRSMHALGILELLIPEFHGIDALVIRDAYHRYTVDEHTFVVIDTLQDLASSVAVSAEMTPWASRFSGLFRDLPHPELLLLASLLHDTGKGHAAADHSVASARMAASVLQRLELDSYETGLVLELIRNHLEMSAALRRDVYDQETIRTFATRVPNPEALRMLALFTYADIAAVHPDALTPWKAENLWRLYQATAHFLDRNVEEQRVASEADSAVGEVLQRIHALLPGRRIEVNRFLEGFPRRYLQTRTPEIVAKHASMAGNLDDSAQDTLELDLGWSAGTSELTLVTTDRPKLFATVAGALAGWGMNIVTADAFSNAHGVVVDSFRFTDTFRTLELNATERERFRTSMRMLITGVADLEAMVQSRRRGRRKSPKVKVETRIEFDQFASTHSTLLEVITQDTPGLLRAISLTLAEHCCNIEVALIDTEGEMAIDVFYVTQDAGKLDATQKSSLKSGLLEAIERNAR